MKIAYGFQVLIEELVNTSMKIEKYPNFSEELAKT